MSGQASPFRRTTIMIMFAVSFAAFVALLYGLGMGDPLASGKNGEAHGASNSIVGYRALASLLEKTGVPVQYSRSQAGMDDAGLLVLTPGPFTPAADIGAILQQRAYIGPTMIILPKWQVASDKKLKRGWYIAGVSGAINRARKCSATRPGSVSRSTRRLCLADPLRRPSADL